MCYFKCYTYVTADKLGKYSCPTTFTSSILLVQLMPRYNSKWIILQLLFFSWMLISLASTTMFRAPSPKMPLGYVVYICYDNSLAKGRLGSNGGIYLKLNLITRHLAFEGQTSQFQAYVLRMRSD